MRNEMLRLLGIGLFVFCLVVGCGDGAGSTGGGGGGGAIMFEPGPTCIAFCAKAIGECEAFEGDEAACGQGCEEGLAEGGALSEGCETAIEAVFQCATEVDCQGVYDWRDKVPLDSYPCRSSVLVVDAACPGL